MPVTVLGENGAPTWKDTPPLDSILVLRVTAVGETSVAPVTLIDGVPTVTKLLVSEYDEPPLLAALKR